MAATVWRGLMNHRANGELACYVGGRGFEEEVLRQAVGQEVIDPGPKVGGEDPVAWLKVAGMPILAGPFASRPDDEVSVA